MIIRPNDPVVNGGQGDDYFQSFGKEVEFENDEKQAGQTKTLKLGEDVVSLIDGGGNDTLDFSAYESGVSINLSLSGNQTIDTAGTIYNISGHIEVMVGSKHNDEITLYPLENTARIVDGANGTDILNY